MRGLVMEVKGDDLVVLTPQGKYLRIRNKDNAGIGDNVACGSPSVYRIQWVRRHVLAVAASLMLICSAGLGAYGYSQPFGIVSVDINPSIALTYNWFKQVIAVEALNPDGEKLLPELGRLKNRQVPEAVQEVVSAASHAGYLKPELANAVFISVSDRANHGRTTALLNAIEHGLVEVSGETETVLMAGTAETYEQIRHNHGSPMNELVESSLNSTPENDPLTHSSKPLKDILKEQKEKREKLVKPETPEIITPPAASSDKDPGKGKEKEKPASTPDSLKNNGESPAGNTDKKDSKPNEMLDPELQKPDFKNNLPENDPLNNDSEQRNLP